MGEIFSLVKSEIMLQISRVLLKNDVILKITITSIFCVPQKMM